MNYNKILDAHDPNHDLPSPSEPPVSWVELELAFQVEELTRKVKDFERRLANMQDQLDQLFAMS